jgi:hypothetical protein
VRNRLLATQDELLNQRTSLRAEIESLEDRCSLAELAKTSAAAYVLEMEIKIEDMGTAENQILKLKDDFELVEALVRAEVEDKEALEALLLTTNEG